MAKIELHAGIPAHEILALVKARKVTKPQAIAYLQARVDAHVAAGKKPRYATRKALASLRGLDEVEALPEGLATLKQAAKARKDDAPAKAEPKAPKAKAAKAPARKTPAKAAPKAKPADALSQAAQALASLDEAQLAAFLKGVFDARR